VTEKLTESIFRSPTASVIRLKQKNEIWSVKRFRTATYEFLNGVLGETSGRKTPFHRQATWIWFGSIQEKNANGR